MQATRRQLSSSTTFLVKFVVTPICLAIMGVFVLTFFVFAVRDAMHGPSVSRFDAISGPLAVVGFALLIPGPVAYLILRQARLMKAVSVDGDYLYVSNFRREIRVPLAQVESVRGSFWLKGKFEPVGVGFKSETEFGRRIVFIPHYRFFAIGLHPVVRELGALVVSKGGGTTRR